MVDIPQLIFARGQGLALKGIATTHPIYAMGLIYLPDDLGMTIDSAEDLRGRTVANFNSPDWQAFLRQLLKTGGLTDNDVTIVDPAFNSVAALTEGRADAADALFYGERVTLSLLEGQTVGWIDYKDYGVPDMPLFMTVASEPFIAENGDLLAGFNRATARSLRHYVDDAASEDRIEAWTECCTTGAQATGTLESTTAKYAASRGHVYLAADADPDEHTWLLQDPANLQEVLDWAVEIGLVESPDDIEPAEAYFTNDYIDEAAQHPEISL
jgi:putative hydroxymethylpyrimidine transport system substrate-binding protein